MSRRARRLHVSVHEFVRDVAAVNLVAVVYTVRILQIRSLPTVSSMQTNIHLDSNVVTGLQFSRV